MRHQKLWAFCRYRGALSIRKQKAHNFCERLKTNYSLPSVWTLFPTSCKKSLPFKSGIRSVWQVYLGKGRLSNKSRLSGQVRLTGQGSTGDQPWICQATLGVTYRLRCASLIELHPNCIQCDLSNKSFWKVKKVKRKVWMKTSPAVATETWWKA